MTNEKNKYVLGISAFYHDSAAAIIKNGLVVAAAQEERFTRIKHDANFPHNAINYCLEEAYIETEDIDLIVFYDQPILTYDRIIKNAITAGPSVENLFSQATKSVLGVKFWTEQHVLQSIGTLGKEGKILYAGHHMSHAASAFFSSSFKESAIVTLDGVGEWATTTIGKGDGSTIDLVKEVNYPNSLGLLYSAFTYYCGFKVNSGEYKLMGLAPYGKPIYKDKIYEHLIDVKADGSFRLDMDYFAFMEEESMTGERFNAVFGGPPRARESKITRREMDLAASIQAVTEEIVIKIARYAKEITQSKNLCLAGGVALNCVANGKLLKEEIFEEIFIQPAAGDAGGALGAAYVGHYLYYQSKRDCSKSEGDVQQGSYLGPQYGPNEIRAFLERSGYPYEEMKDQNIKNDHLAGAIAEGQVVGFFSGRMEFGPRSLGARSIIGDSRNAEMQSKMNLKIKYRESFRPFAPAVLEEDIEEFFDISTLSPYMLLVAPIKESRRSLIEEGVEKDEEENMIEIINQERSDVPAVTHVDYSARIQSVNKQTNPTFHGLLTAFKELTGYGILVNTSFNVRGEPIVCTPKDAYRCFMRTEMDILMLGDFVLDKKNQPEFSDNKDWTQEFELD